MKLSAKHAGLAIGTVVIAVVCGILVFSEHEPDRSNVIPDKKVIRPNAGHNPRKKSGTVTVFDPSEIVPGGTKPKATKTEQVPDAKAQNAIKLPSDRIKLVVIDADGLKLAGSAVKARTQRGNLENKATDQAGEAEYTGLDPSTQFYAQVWHPRFNSARAIGPVPTGTLFELQFPPEQAGQVTIVCTDDAGNAVTNARIFATHATLGLRAELNETCLKSLGSGEFDAKLGLGRVSIFAKAEGFSQSNTAWVSPTESGKKRVELILPRFGTLDAQLVGLVGSGTDVVVECDATIGKRPYTRIETFEREAPISGTQFTLNNLPPGSYKLRCFVKSDRAQGTPWQKLVIKSGEATRHDFQLTQLKLSVEGRLEDEEGQPIEGATIMCHVSSATTDSDGNFRFYGIPPGIQRMTIRARGYATKAVSVAVLSNKVEKHTIKLSSYGLVSGRIIDQNGVPLPGTRIHLIEYRDGREGDMISLTADKLGNFKFTEVRPGAYFFVVADQSPHFTEDKVLIKISAGREVRLPVTYERE